MSVREALREKGTRYAELGHGDPSLSDDALLDAMTAHPIPINRPFVTTPQLGAFAKEDGEVVVDATGHRLK